jgi:uncharacterized membrane protein YhaH (DUF805 family)
MSSGPQYTLARDGQKYGPYPLTLLRDYHSQGLVQGGDLVWTEGLTTWVPVRDVLARVGQAPSPPPVATPPPIAQPQPMARDPRYAPPLSHLHDVRAARHRQTASARDQVAALFSMDGRLNRARYFWTLVALFGAMLVASFFLGVFLAITIDDYQTLDSATDVLGTILGLIFQVVIAFQVVKRLHDLDRPGVHYWLLLLPFYNIYLAVLILFKKGTEGPNRFGPDPLQSS